MAGDLAETFLMVSDIEESVSFYTDVIGLELTKWDGDARFDTGGATLVLEEDFDEEVLAGFGLEPPGESRGDGVIVVLEVDDPDEIAARAADHDYEVVSEPRDVDWGRRMCLLADPDGYMLEVSKPLEGDSLDGDN
jgi:catechol 2,3-dioxygenase-like lactoylglutathione lyase family enzyme